MFFQRFLKDNINSEQRSKQLAAAQKMLENGFSVHDVAQITELPVGMIKKEKRKFAKEQKVPSHAHIA